MLLAPLSATQARNAPRRPDPEAHTLKPRASRPAVSPYQACLNYGKRIAVFGGSLSVNKESDEAKQIWADLLNAHVVSYGVPGAGFALSKGYSIQRQVDTAGVFDVYVLWASTNDFTGNKECGSHNDYSPSDSFDSSRLDTQCGGINYCIKKLREKNPEAEIYFFTSLRFFSRDSGHNPYSSDVNKIGKTFAEYVEAQIECCRSQGVPVFDQFNIQGVGPDNFDIYYSDDKLHLNEKAYRKIGYKQAAFLSNGK